jgi:hypothetical protein
MLQSEAGRQPYSIRSCKRGAVDIDPIPESQRRRRPPLRPAAPASHRHRVHALVQAGCCRQRPPSSAAPATATTPPTDRLHHHLAKKESATCSPSYHAARVARARDEFRQVGRPAVGRSALKEKGVLSGKRVESFDALLMDVWFENVAQSHLSKPSTFLTASMTVVSRCW